MRLFSTVGLVPVRLLRGTGCIAWAVLVTVAVSLGLTDAAEE